MKMKLMILVMALGAASMMHAQATKTIMDAWHLCKVTIPGTWKTNSILTSGNSADSKMDAAVAAGAPGQTLAQIKPDRLKVYRASYVSVNVTEDSATAFEIDAADQGMGPKDGSIYRAVVSGANVCIVQANYHNGDLAGTKMIAKSLGAK